MIDLSSGLLAEHALNEADLAFIRGATPRQGNEAAFDVATAKLRVLVRVFGRFCGAGANPELVRSLAANAHAFGERYEINSYARWTHFAAQWGYLTDGLRITHALAVEKFGTRGLLRTSGEHSYRQIGEFLRQDLVAFPKKLDQPDICVESAFAEWHALGLNEIADTDDLEAVTRRLDRNLTDMHLRRAWLLRARSVWPDPASIMHGVSSAETGPPGSTLAFVRITQAMGLLAAVLGGGGVALRAYPWGDVAAHANTIGAHAPIIAIVGGILVASAAEICRRSIVRDYRRGLLCPRR